MNTFSLKKNLGSEIIGPCSRFTLKFIRHFPQSNSIEYIIYHYQWKYVNILALLALVNTWYCQIVLKDSVVQQGISLWL